jgi:hypothetical protein
MANRFFNKQVSPRRSAYGWETKANNVYPGSGKNAAGDYNCPGSPKDKRGPKGARNSADKSGRAGKTFADNFKRS